MTDLKCLILAAGKGSRMKTDRAKVLHTLAGLPLINWVVNAAARLQPQEIVTVIAPDMIDTVGRAVAPNPYVIQDKQLGTGHAVLSAKEKWRDYKGRIMVLLGDAPLINSDDLSKMITIMDKEKVPCVMMTMELEDPAQFGRVVSKGAEVEYIVEYKDATPAQREITLCAVGAYVFDAESLWAALAQIKNDNANGEYYLPDAVHILRAQGHKVLHHCIEDATEALGVNSKTELADLEYRLQNSFRRHHLNDGVQMIDPETVYFAHDTKIGRDVLIEPHVYFACGVEIEDGVQVRSFSHLEGCVIRKNAVIGPFARLRSGAVIGEECRIGNFVEIKKATFGAGSKANHLSYIGDAEIGERVNIGAGTITCNYDGYFKYKTEIGDGAFIGSNTALVAPVEIGAGAIIGAGTTINDKVEADMLVLTRAHRIEKAEWAKGFRERKKAEKEQAKNETKKSA